MDTECQEIKNEISLLTETIREEKYQIMNVEKEVNKYQTEINKLQSEISKIYTTSKYNKISKSIRTNRLHLSSLTDKLNKHIKSRRNKKIFDENFNKYQSMLISIENEISTINKLLAENEEKYNNRDITRSEYNNVNYDLDNKMKKLITDDFKSISQTIHEVCEHDYVHFANVNNIKNKNYEKYHDSISNGKLYLNCYCHCGVNISGCSNCLIDYCQICHHLKWGGDCNSCDGAY